MKTCILCVGLAFVGASARAGERSAALFDEAASRMSTVIGQKLPAVDVGALAAPDAAAPRVRATTLVIGQVEAREWSGKNGTVSLAITGFLDGRAKDLDRALRSRTLFGAARFLPDGTMQPTGTRLLEVRPTLHSTRYDPAAGVYSMYVSFEKTDSRGKAMDIYGDNAKLYTWYEARSIDGKFGVVLTENWMGMNTAGALGWLTRIETALGRVPFAAKGHERFMKNEFPFNALGLGSGRPGGGFPALQAELDRLRSEARD